jgi:hypothetical protein
MTMGANDNVYPPGLEAEQARQADDIAVAALNAVDPTGSGWRANPLEVMAAVTIRMLQAEQILMQRARPTAVDDDGPEAA